MSKVFHPKKRFGQNFLVNRNIANVIMSSADLKGEDVVLEIGAGRGELTEDIAKICNVIAVELDRDLFAVLQKKFEKFKNVKLIQGDILKLNFKGLSDSKMKVIGNIPYYITSPILFKIVDNKKYFSTIVLTVQKEIAERIVSKEGSKSYGVLSIMLRYNTEPEIVQVVSKNCFYPVPEVDSAIIKLNIPDGSGCEANDRELFNNLVRTSFQQRRKTFKNALLRMGYDKEIIKNIFNELKLDLGIRGEEISIKQFVEISNLLLRS